MALRKPRLFLAYTEAEFAQAYSGSLQDRLERSVELVRQRGHSPLDGPALARAAAGCELLIAYRSTACAAATLQALPELRALLRAAVDVSTIDLDEASRQGVLVTRVSPGFFNAVAELGVGLMIDLARGVTLQRLRLARGETAPPRQGRELAGAVLGFVGYGGIARHLNGLARSLGMRTLAHDPMRSQADIPLLPLDDLLATADFVVCLAASTPRTRHLFDAQAFASMKPGAFFLNLSRGELVDEDALERALDTGHLAGAALDVGSAADQKPAARFHGRADVVLSQHIGASTHQARERQTLDTLEQVEAIVSGRLPAGAINTPDAHRFQQWQSHRGSPSSVESST